MLVYVYRPKHNIRYLWCDQAKSVWSRSNSVSIFLAICMHHFQGYILQKTPLRLVNWFQRYEQLKDAKNNRKQKKLSALYGSILKSIFPTSDWFCLITSHLVILDLKIHQSMWIYWSFFPKTWTKGHWPHMTFDPKSVEVTCVTLPKDHCVQVTQKYIKVCGYSDPFLKNLNQRSLTPRWPLTPCLLRSHVWLYPRIIVSKSHGNTSMYVDTVINFAKITTYYIPVLCTYYVLHTEWVTSPLLNSVQVRQKCFERQST